MGIGGLGDWFKKRLDDAQGAYHQVNVFDGGRTFNTNAQGQQPFHAPANPQQPQRNIFERGFDQVNPFDAGRDFKVALPQQDNSSVLHQMTHNGLTNTIGNLTYKPVAATVGGFITEPARNLLAEATGNQAAAHAADLRTMQNIHASIPGFFADQLVNAGKVAYNLPQAVMADVHGFQGKAPTPQEQAALQHGLHAFNQSVVGQMTGPAQNVIDAVVPGAAEQSKAAGYDPHRTAAQKYVQDPVMGGLGTAGIVGGVKVAARTPAAQEIAANHQAMMADQAGAVRIGKGNQEAPPPLKVGGTKERGFVTSVKNSPEVSPETQGMVEGTYTPVNAKARAAAADAAVKKDLDAATNAAQEALAKPEGTLSDQEISHVIATAKAYDAKGTEVGHNIATDLYEKLAPHGTVKGQGVQAFADLRTRTPEGMKFKVVRDLKKSGVQLDKESQSMLETLIDGIRQTKDGTTERDMAIHNMVTFVNKKLPTSAGDKIVNFWRAGLLSSPVTTGGNILGNMTEAATRNLWTNPVASAADATMSLVTGKRTKTMAGGQTTGIKIGAKKAGVYLKTGFDERNPITKLDAKHEINYGSSPIAQVANHYVNGVYRWMGGQDQPFYYAAKSQAVRDMAKADAKNLGLKGDKANAYVEQAAADPNFTPQTFKSEHGAMEAGKYAVYQNETALGHIAGQLKQPFKIGNKTFDGSFRQFLVPFSQVPASVATRIIDRTPLGIAKEAVQQYKDGNFDQRAMAEAIGNGTFAPGVIATGYALSKNGDIAGNYPTDPKEQELWKMEGKQANSVKIGNRWYSLNYMQPFGVLLGIGAQAHTDAKAGKSPEEIIANASGTAAKSVESQSFLQGINGVLSAVNDPQRSAQKYVTTTASSAVPNFIRTSARATDPLQRDAKGVVQGVESAIPGLREGLPAKQDVFGRDLPAVDTPLNQFANPTRPSRVRGQDNVTQELRRLQDTQNGIMPTQYNKSTFAGKDGKGPKLTDQQIRDLQSQVGPNVYKAWQSIISDPSYKGLSDPDKATALKKAMDDTSKLGKEMYATGDSSVKLSSQPGLKLSGLSSDYVQKAKNDVALQSFKTSGDKTKMIGDTYYFKKKDGSVSSMPKVEYDFNITNSKLNLGMDRAQAKDDIGTWMKLAEQQYNALEKKKGLYDPGTESDKIDAITLAQENLMQKVEKYQEYGGFKKGSGGRGVKKGSLPQISVGIPSDLSNPVVSNASYTAPKYQLKNKGAVKLRARKTAVKLRAPAKI